jgi:hypothetical protein
VIVGVRLGVNIESFGELPVALETKTLVVTL